MSISNKLIGITPTAGGVEPVGIDFDGTNDYLSRSSDLTGNADSKTYTFSCWFYWTTTTSPFYNTRNPSNSNYGVQFSSNTNGISVYVTDSAGTVLLNIQQGDINEGLASNTWYQFTFSADHANLTYAGYINDEVITWGNVVTDIVDGTPDFTTPSHIIGKFPFNSTALEGRLAGVYLDYTYRDLSVEANRRDFIDADGRYVTPPTTGIISVPMDDPEDPGRNDGTGGDFTLNGTIAQSGRGPNQYNAAASTFDGSADYLSRSSAPTGIADGKQVTISFNVKLNGTGVNYVLDFGQTSQYGFVYVTDNFDSVEFGFKNSSGTEICRIETGTGLILDKWYNISLSVDLTNTANRYVLIDGSEQSLTVTTYTNDDIDFTRPDWGIAANRTGGAPLAGEISDLWFDTTYIDLSADNPFYDSETGKPKDLGVDGSNPTGSAPLIYLPLRADDAGSNKGTGGDFTVNSGPYVGARGPSEFWGESVTSDGSTGDLTLSPTYTASTHSGATFVFCFTRDSASSTGNEYLFSLRNSSNSAVFTYRLRSDELIDFGVLEADGTTSLVNATNMDDDTNSSFTTVDKWYLGLISLDFSSGVGRYFLNGVDKSSDLGTVNTGTFSVPENFSLTILSDFFSNTEFWQGKAAGIYFATEYIDFSQEANRLKFVDAFGYPTDIHSKINNGEIPNPLIYLPFDDSNDLGKNLGTGGDFTVNGTVTQSGFVKG